jgi:Flp pilus assembly pilin Flp
MAVEARMVRRVYAFCLEDQGQDVVEYTLLLAFVVFTLAGLFFSISGSTAGIVSVSNSQISYANSMLH